MLAGVGFADAQFHGWTVYRTSPYTQGAHLTARKPGSNALSGAASEFLPPREQPRRLLFVCVENSCRSQMAEAFARLHGNSRVEVHSAGSRPSGRVHPLAVALMGECGCNLGSHRSKGLNEVPDVEFEVVVTMGCGDVCRGMRARKREVWDLPAPKEMPPEQFRGVRDRIERKVKDLLAELGVIPRTLS
jgi:protein-tyrosine-phosphatase